MPFESFIVARSTTAGVDPMLTAGLIRQESAYDPEAHSHANAFGLMQLLPKTARRFAKQAKVRYSTPMLFEPDYNIHIGTIYFAGLQRRFRQRRIGAGCLQCRRRSRRVLDQRARAIASRPSLWIPFRSRKRASTWKSLRATPIFIVSYTGRNPCEARRMNPVKPQAAPATSPQLSWKAAQFTESVIREMTRLALQHKAVNLSQGFPDFPAPALIKSAAQDAIAADINQYAITWGAKSLRNAIAAKFSRTNAGMAIDPEREITVCCGSTEAMISVDAGGDQSWR